MPPIGDLPGSLPPKKPPQPSSMKDQSTVPPSIQPLPPLAQHSKPLARRAHSIPPPRRTGSKRVESLRKSVVASRPFHPELATIDSLLTPDQTREDLAQFDRNLRFHQLVTIACREDPSFEEALRLNQDHLRETRQTLSTTSKNEFTLFKREWVALRADLVNIALLGNHHLLDETLITIQTKIQENENLTPEEKEIILSCLKQINSFNPQNLANQVLFLNDLILNKKHDSLVNMQKLRKNVLSHQREIEQMFPVLRNYPFENFSVESNGKETHNKGNKPVKLSWTSNGNTFSLYYKPRNADTDLLVSQCFANMGLPFCKIVSFPSCSVWEFIEGKEMLLPRRGNADIQRYINSKPREEQETLREQYANLQAAALAIGVYDLHGENVLYHSERGLVPIDLECLYNPHQLRNVNRPNRTFTSEQEQAIDQFNREKHKIVARMVLIGTQELSINKFATNTKKVNDTAKNLVTQMRVHGYQPVSGAEQLLQMRVWLDFLHDDIPYFTTQDNRLYYGLPSDGVLIGLLEETAA